jgi:hypothetical protein
MTVLMAEVAAMTMKARQLTAETSAAATMMPAVTLMQMAVAMMMTITTMMTVMAMVVFVLEMKSFLFLMTRTKVAVVMIRAV